MRRTRPTGFSGIVVVAATMATAMLMAPSCKTNPATGRTQLDALSRQQEIQYGEEAAPKLTTSYGGPIPDRDVRNYVSGIGNSIARGVETPYRSLPWEFTLLNSGTMNAFALPGGKVFVTRGLAERFENEAQLAGAIAHEVAHVTAEHADEAMQRALILAGIAAGVESATSDEESTRIAAGALITGAGLFALQFDRNQESEADQIGLRYMTAAGYDPRGLLQVMEVLRDASQSAARIEWLSTHPLPSTRIFRIENRLANERYQAAMNDGAHGFYEERYQIEMLDRLRQLPPPPPPPQGRRPTERLLEHPERWCGLCAARHAALRAGS